MGHNNFLFTENIQKKKKKVEVALHKILYTNVSA